LRGFELDIDEFEKQVKPGAKRSRMEPYRAQIFALKSKGYADSQVRDWLATNGVIVSRQAVQQFVKKRQALMTANAPAVTTRHALSTKDSGNVSPSSKITNPADIRKARKREIDLSDYSEPEKE
jgi:hypothetical protein